MNCALYRLHRAFFIGCMIGVLLFVIIGMSSPDMNGKVFAIIFFFVVAPFGIAHYFAAVGARKGKAWGRDISRIIATLLLIGFPLGTAIGLYIFYKTGDQWQNENGQRKTPNPPDTLNGNWY